MAAADFSAPIRLGYRTGDQWEPSIAADGHGHLYVLYPQYGDVPDCARCSAPAMALLISDDNGASWHPSKVMLTFPTGQFDPQIVVDPADHQTIYASWLQNEKRDIVVARSQDFGRNWSFSWAERGDEDTDKPVLAVRGADVYVGFNHEERFVVSASHDAGQTFNVVAVNPNADTGSSSGGRSHCGSFRERLLRVDCLCRSRPAVSARERVYQPLGRWRTELDHAATGSIQRTSGLWGQRLRNRISWTSDCAGFGRCWRCLRSVECGECERRARGIYFASSTTNGASWSARSNVSGTAQGVEHAFPAITAGASGDVRIAWMDARANEPGRPNRVLWNTFYRTSTNGGASWNAESQLSAPVGGYDYILPAGYRFPFGDYFGLAIDSNGATHAVWGEGRNYNSPGSIWYVHGR